MPRPATLIFIMREPVPIPFREVTTKTKGSAFQIALEFGFHEIHYCYERCVSKPPKSQHLEIK
jgi:hypothetical protein